MKLSKNHTTNNSKTMSVNNTIDLKGLRKKLRAGDLESIGRQHNVSCSYVSRILKTTEYQRISDLGLQIVEEAIKRVESYEQKKIQLAKKLNDLI